MEQNMIKILNVGVENYNSYIIAGEKNILIDTVPEEFQEEFIGNLQCMVDILVMTRTTPDAAGCVEALLRKNPEMEIFSTVAGLKNLKEILNTPFNEKLIKNDAFIELGEDRLKFLITPNLSWPDTSICYLEKEKALFSGNLYCDSPEDEYLEKEFLADAIDKIFKLDVDTLYPGYNDFKGFFVYDEFINSEDFEEYVVLYASTSGQTEKLAKCVYDELKTQGKNVFCYDCDLDNQKEILEKINKASAIFIGTPTIHHNAHRELLNTLISINVIKNSGKPAFVFGSFGFSGEGTNIVAKLLGNLKMKVMKKPYRCILNPSEKNILDLRQEISDFLEGLSDA